MWPARSGLRRILPTPSAAPVVRRSAAEGVSGEFECTILSNGWFEVGLAVKNKARRTQRSGRLCRNSKRARRRCKMSTESLPSKPPVEAYSDEEFQVVVDHIHKVGWKVDDFEERAEKRIDRKGRGPHCPECEMKPAGVKERSVHGDWGQVQHYRCLRCEHEFQGVRRYMYEDDDE